MNLSYTISGLRRAGLTQTQIGAEVGLKQPTISEIESGKCGITRPTYELVAGLEALAKKHGVATEPQSINPTSRRRPRKSATIPP